MIADSSKSVVRLSERRQHLEFMVACRRRTCWEKMRLETVRSPLEFVRDSREVMINGARCWLCFPVIEQMGNFW